MALIIKGDLPKGCGFCWECLGGGSDAYYCNRAKRQISEVVPPYDKRMEWCPILGEIPDEHGRLVDADALIERTKNWYCSKENCEDNYSGVRCRACWVDDAIGIIDDANVVVEGSRGSDN